MIPYSPLSFVWGVEQQPTHLLQQWADMGVNTVVRWGKGEDPVKWVAEANRLNLFQIREPVGDPAEDAKNSLLVAWTTPWDEPDYAGKTHLDLAAEKAKHAAAGSVRDVPWFGCVSGGYFTGLLKPPAPIDYPALFSQMDMVAADIYPVSGWSDPKTGEVQAAVDLFAPANLNRKLQSLNAGKPSFAYLECGKQADKLSPTVAELHVEAEAILRTNPAGIILFPLYPTNPGFAWDCTTVEMKRAIMELIRTH